MDAWDLLDVEDMNQLDASSQRRRRPTMHNPTSSSDAPIDQPLPARGPIDFNALLRGDGAESPSETTSTNHDINRPEHILFRGLGSQFDTQDRPSRHEDAQPHPRHSAERCRPTLWLFFIRITVALVAITLCAYRLSKAPITQTKAVILAGGLLIAAVTGHRYIGMNRKFEDTVNMLLLCLVSSISMAVTL